MNDNNFSAPKPALQRPDILEGYTYKIKAPNAGGQTINIYLTVNEQDGRPFEVFMNCSDNTVYELVSVSMVLVSRLLRLGVSLETIAEDLEQVTSALTAHMDGQQWCPSLIARIGRTLKGHEARRQAILDLVPVQTEHA
jgi:hypothetical protein